MNDIEVKEKFLWDLGVRSSQYPESFFDRIEDINKLVTNVELGYCAVCSRCDGQVETFCIKDVVGTDHPRYAGQTWIDAFFDLDRGANIIKLYQQNPEYWEENKNLDDSDIGLIKYGDKYYIFSNAGGGNNRLIAMKIRYLSLIHQAGNDQDEIERINKQFTFAANVRNLPKDSIIPFIAVAIDEDLLGLSIIKIGPMFVVTKKFTDIELFKGDELALVEYFKSLFDANLYGESVVKSRLENLEMAFHFSSEKYKKVLEDIIPSLISDNHCKKI